MGSSFDHIYQEMRERNLAKIESNGLTYDPLLLRETISKRRSFCLFAYFEEQLSDDFETIYKEAVSEFPSQVIYSPDRSDTSSQHGLLHFTYFQLIQTGNVVYPLSEKLILEYVDTLTESILSINPFSVQYEGLIALPGNIVIEGHPSIDINKTRQQMRESIYKKKLLFDEPYISDTAHSTFVRFASPENSKKVISFAERYKTSDIGALRVSKFFMGYGTWKMNSNEIEMLYSLDLAQKKVEKLL